jgi:hypothetical protein
VLEYLTIVEGSECQVPYDEVGKKRHRTDSDIKDEYNITQPDLEAELATRIDEWEVSTLFLAAIVCNANELATTEKACCDSKRSSKKYGGSDGRFR